MKKRGHLRCYPGSGSLAAVTGKSGRQDGRISAMLRSFIATRQHHAHAALAYRALIPSIPVPPSKFLTTQVFDTF